MQTAASAFDPDAETSAADEGTQSEDQVAMALAAPDLPDVETGPTVTQGGEAT